MRYGIVLLPDESLSRKLVDYSNSIATPDTLMSLDSNERLPHITLGFLTAFPASAKLPEDLLGTTFEGRMAFGRVGPYGTFPEFFERL